MNAARAVIRGIGELFITAGLVLLLFAAYQLVWTNVEAAQAQDQVAEGIADAWSKPEPRVQPSDAKTEPGKKKPPADDTVRLTRADFGQGFAFLRIPRLGQDFKVPVVEGVRDSDLSRGVGHYPQTALPGQIGNFAVAGHRATNGEPFRTLDRMRKGDAVVVETRNTWLTYVVDEIKIVSPSDTWVVAAVPGRPNVQPTERLLTLTTCHPRWASTYRLIVFAHLESKKAKKDGTPAALLASGG
jgi:sortase A